MQKRAFILSFLLIISLSSIFTPCQAAGPWVGSKNLVYSGVLNINLGIFYTENQTLQWSFTSTSETVNISVYKFVNYAGGGGQSIILDYGIGEGQGTFEIETYLNYSIRFAHVDFEHREENATVTAVISVMTNTSIPTTSETIFSATIIIISLSALEYLRKRKDRK